MSAPLPSPVPSDALTQLLLNPSLHIPLSILKGFRNGLVYGTKIRFPHALVMVLLFRSAPLPQKLRLILTATRTHARNLACFVTLYKTSSYAIRTLVTGGKERGWESFAAGLLGGYVVFGRPGPARSSVNQQIVIYVFARVVLGLAKLWAEQGRIPGFGGENGMKGAEAWPVFAAVSWAVVMWLFRWHPEVLQPSLRSSMTYLYTNSEKWTGWKDFLWHNQ